MLALTRYTYATHVGQGKRIQECDDARQSELLWRLHHLITISYTYKFLYPTDLIHCGSYSF